MAIDLEEVGIRLTEHELELRHHGERLDNLEANTKVLTDMATSLAVMARDQKTLTNKVDSVIAKVDVLEQRPAKRWDAVVGAVISAIVGVVIGLMLKGGI